MNDLAHDLTNARPLDLARERVEELASKYEAWKAADLSDDETARRAADYFNQLRGERQRIEDERKAEKAPLLAQGKIIDKAHADVTAPLGEPWAMISGKVTALLQSWKAAGREASLRGNYSSRAIALKSLWRAEITDQLQLYLYYADHPDIRETLQRLANAEAPAAHREGREIPGCKLVEREIAA